MKASIDQSSSHLSSDFSQHYDTLMGYKWRIHVEKLKYKTGIIGEDEFVIRIEEALDHLLKEIKIIKSDIENKGHNLGATTLVFRINVLISSLVHIKMEYKNGGENYPFTKE